MNDKINIIPNYISKDSCLFINKAFEKYLSETPNKYIMGGPSGWIGKHRYTNDITDIKENFTQLPNNTIPYMEDPNYNVAVDMMIAILQNMCKTVSDYYGEEYVMRSFFYGVMHEGAKNTMHMDNHYLNSNTQTIMPRTNSDMDRSAILYLNDDYEGGKIHFPLQKMLLKPEIGTLLFFEGNQDVPHEVQVVESGVRKNIITFFIKKSLVSDISSWENADSGQDGPEDPLTLSFVQQMNKDLI